MIATPFNILVACATGGGLRRTTSLMKLKLVSPRGAPVITADRPNYCARLHEYTLAGSFRKKHASRRNVSLPGDWT
jgi:hypothetical protein